MTLQDIWIDFKIISMLEPARKLYINDDALALEPISLFSPLKRWLTNSNRRCVIIRIKQRVEELETYFKKKDYEALFKKDTSKSKLKKLGEKCGALMNSKDSSKQIRYAIFTKLRALKVRDEPGEVPSVRAVGQNLNLARCACEVVCL